MAAHGAGAKRTLPWEDSEPLSGHSQQKRPFYGVSHDDYDLEQSGGVDAPLIPGSWETPSTTAISPIENQGSVQHVPGEPLQNSWQTPQYTCFGVV